MDVAGVFIFVCRVSRVHVVLESAGAGLDGTGAGFWFWWILDWRRLCAIFHQVKWTIVNNLQFICNINRPFTD